MWDPKLSNEENQKTWRHNYVLGLVSEFEEYGKGYSKNTYHHEYGSVLRRDSCLTNDEIFNYLNKDKNVMCGKVGYAWNIDNLVIFDRPKELSKFYKRTIHSCEKCKYKSEAYCHFKCLKRLTKAPQNYMFIEVDE